MEDDCVPGKECTNLPIAATCTDEDTCSTGDVCMAGNCEPGKETVCKDGKECTDDACDSAKGCVFSVNGNSCDDGNPCTESDSCATTECTGVPTNCDDDNVCTADSCLKASGCIHEAIPSAKACNDGNACTSGDVCAAGKCVGTAKSCDDGNVCTDDACNGKTGTCAKVENAAPCDDGSACTGLDGCSAGKCVAGNPKLLGKTVGGSKDDHLIDAAALPDGGVAFVGETESTDLPDGVKSAGSSDLWAMRTDMSGKVLWSKTFGGTGMDYGLQVVAQADGGLAFCGTSASSSLPGGAGNAGSQDFWFTRTDGDGNLLVSKTYGGASYDGCRALATQSGTFALAGYSSSYNLPMGAKSLGQDDYWLLRVDAAGTVLSSATFGGTASDICRSMTATSDDGLALLGSTRSGALPGGEKTAGGLDLWLVRTDPKGNLLWSKTYGGSGDDSEGCVMALQDGGFLLTASSPSTDLPGGAKSSGGMDGWLLRTDAGGKLLWSRTYGGSGADSLYRVALPQDGSFLAFGYSGSTNLAGGAKGAGLLDAWALRVDNFGNVLDSRLFGGSGDDSAEAIVGFPDGGLLLATRTTSTNLPGGAKTAGGIDAWFLRTDAWLNLTCPASGPCYSKPAASCDDKNPCTADLCDAAHTGCWHTNLADGSACGNLCSPNSTCAAGACTPAVPAPCVLPSSIPGLQFWLYASDTKNLSMDAQGLVSKWQDKSGKGNHAFQDSGGSRPKWLAKAELGKPGVAFDGADDWMTMPDFMTPGSLSIVFAATKRTSGKAYPTLLSNYGAGDGTEIVSLSDAVGASVRDKGNNSLSAKVLFSKGFAIRAVVFDAAAGKLTLTTGGVPTTVSGVLDKAIHFGGGEPPLLGAQGSTTATPQANGDTHWNGDLHELLVFDHALSAGELGVVTAWLQGRWMP